MGCLVTSVGAIEGLFVGDLVGDSDGEFDGEFVTMVGVCDGD